MAKMQTSKTLGQALREHMAAGGQRPNKAKTARALDIGTGRLESLLADNGDIDAALALKLAKCFKTNPGYWMQLQASRDLKRAEEEQQRAERWKNPPPSSPWWPHAKYALQAIFRHPSCVEIEPHLLLCVSERDLPDYGGPGSAGLYKRAHVFYVEEELPSGRLTVWYDRYVTFHRPKRNATWGMLFAEEDSPGRDAKSEIRQAAEWMWFHHAWDGEYKRFSDHKKAPEQLAGGNLLTMPVGRRPQ